MRRTAGIVLITLAASGLAAGQTAKAPEKTYWVKLVCEASDKILTVRFSEGAAKVERTTETRILQSDISGPHGIAFSPGGEYFYVSIGHGRPFGTAVKYRAADDTVVKQVGLGLFPATADVSPDGNFLYVANFNLHGDMVPSSVSVVDTNQMMEVARIPTCIMPHGSRVTRNGEKQYSACMMDDLLVEIDAQRMKVLRKIRVSAGQEKVAASGAAAKTQSDPHAGMKMEMSGITCMPTWAQPSADGKRIYVACNKSNEIVEVDAADGSARRRIAAGNGVYNLGVTADGKLLIATNKRDASVSIFEIESGKEVARLATKRKVVHGVAVSPDGKYAFVTAEGIGEEPGSLEVIDLGARKTVATLETPPQAAGIDFWKME